MKKVIVFVVACLLASGALATDFMGSVDRPLHNLGTVTLPQPNSRSGTCEVYNYDPALSASLWGPSPGEAYAVFLDPSLDGHGDCAAPFYPFLIDTVDLPLALWGTSPYVGQTVCYNVAIACPKDGPSTNIVQECKGPGGPAYAMVDICYTVTYDDSVNGIAEPRVPINTCVDGPFYVVVTYTSFTGDPAYVPSIILNYPVNTGWRPCTSWLYGQLGLGGGITSDFCWFEMRIDINWGTGVFAGPWWVSVHGEAGAACPPQICPTCPRTYPGDDAAHPILVNSMSWSSVIDLCQFCSDYDQRYDDQITGGSFTANGADVVLSIPFDPALPQVCFAVTIIPMRPDTAFPFRIRSWINDSYGTLYDGNPRFPLFGISQSYDFTATGIGCQAADNYLLFIDTRGCCTQVLVNYSGDQPLPVELSNFDAVGGDGLVNLSWITRSERSIERYELTRNGEFLVSVPGLGDNPSGHTYTYVDRDVINGRTYTYSLTAYNLDGSIIVYPQTTSATPMAGVVTEYVLNQNYPNPFNPTTSITYAVKDAGPVTLKVYTIDGREVATLVNGVRNAGMYTVTFDARDLASGVYLYKLEANSFSATHKMVLMK